MTFSLNQYFILINALGLKIDIQFFLEFLLVITLKTQPTQGKITALFQSREGKQHILIFHFPPATLFIHWGKERNSIIRSSEKRLSPLHSGGSVPKPSNFTQWCRVCWTIAAFQEVKRHKFLQGVLIFGVSNVFKEAIAW